MGEKAVSQVVGFVLTFVIISTATVAIIYTTSFIINTRIKETTYIVAQDVANYVANAVTETLSIKQNFILANYTSFLDVPRSILGKSYYIELTDKYVYVNVSDGTSARCELFKQEELAIPFSGKVYPESGKIKIWTERNKQLYLLDFGTNSSEESPAAYKFLRVTKSSCIESLKPWDDRYREWAFRSNIIIENPSDRDLYDYQIKLILSPDDFCYFVAQRDGGDIRIVSEEGKELPYWIESWRYNGISYIWFRADHLLANSTTTFYLYYGNPNAKPVSSGDNTFIFFDDFDTFNSSRWAIPYQKGDVYVEDGYLVLRDGAAILAKGLTISNGALETKAYVVMPEGSNNTESSLFIRSTSDTDPYNNSYVLSSGIFNDPEYSVRNFSVGRYGNLSTGGKLPVPMDENRWYRLSFFSYVNMIGGMRYYHYNPIMYEQISRYDATDVYEGGFGLHTSVEGAYAVYDWVFLRNYYYIEPYVVDIGGPASQVYMFATNVNNLDFFVNLSQPDKLLKDGVMSGYPAVFNMSLPKGNYSVLIHFGHPSRAINKMSLYIEGNEVLSDFSCDAGAGITKCFYVDLKDNNLGIVFKPTDIWSIYGIEVLSGKRGVFIGGI